MPHLVPAWLVGTQRECTRAARKMWKRYARGAPFAELFADMVDLDEVGGEIDLGDAFRGVRAIPMMRPISGFASRRQVVH